MEEGKELFPVIIGAGRKEVTPASLPSQYPLQHLPAHNTVIIRTLGGSRRDGAGPQADRDMTDASHSL